jgi:hypothetical protein
VIPADTTLLGGYPRGGGARDPAANVTVLDGAGAPPVVRFPPGSDGTILDGFVVRRGGTPMTLQSYGGGIEVVDASPLIRGNVIEDSTRATEAGWRSGTRGHAPATRGWRAT